MAARRSRRAAGCGPDRGAAIRSGSKSFAAGVAAVRRPTRAALVVGSLRLVPPLRRRGRRPDARPRRGARGWRPSVARPGRPMPGRARAACAGAGAPSPARPCGGPFAALQRVAPRYPPAGGVHARPSRRLRHGRGRAALRHARRHARLLLPRGRRGRPDDGLGDGRARRSDAARAADLGMAFQLTNIARDVGDDLAAGRIYLPAGWLAAAGVPLVPRQPHRRAGRPRAWRRSSARLLDEADRYYDSAQHGLPRLPWRSAWAVATARHVYRDIGVEVRRRGGQAWRERVVTTTARQDRAHAAGRPRRHMDQAALRVHRSGAHGPLHPGRAGHVTVIGA